MAGKCANKYRVGEMVQDISNNHTLEVGGISKHPNQEPDYYLLTNGSDGGYWVSECDLRRVEKGVETDAALPLHYHGDTLGFEVGNGIIPEKSMQSDTSDSGSAATSKHYNSKLIQPIEISQMVLTHEEFIGAMKFNIMKYTQRAGSKEGESSTKDWNKALQYKLWLEMAERGETIDPRKNVV